MTTIAESRTTDETTFKIEHPQVSVVIPCLNEEKTIKGVIEEAQSAFRTSHISCEIVIADNGSTDQSARLAIQGGARVISVPQKGYGAALQAGFSAATGEIIVFGDADATYDFNKAPQLVQLLLASSSAMVIGSRLNRTIEKGAMPFLHRYLGTPVLTRLINILFHAQLTDCNSGFRALRRERLVGWGARSTGMEFASEIIVNCLRSGDRIEESPITLRKDRRGRPPHLSTWRDGMRHLMIILSKAPQGFTYTGAALVSLSLLVAIPCIFIGPLALGPISIFDFHSLILATLTGLLGAQGMSYGLLLDTDSREQLPINRKLFRVSEVTLLKLLLSLMVFIVGFATFVGVTWLRHGFNNIHFLRPSLALLYVAVVFGTLTLGTFIAHVQRRG